MGPTPHRRRGGEGYRVAGALLLLLLPPLLLLSLSLSLSLSAALGNRDSDEASLLLLLLLLCAPVEWDMMPLLRAERLAFSREFRNIVYWIVRGICAEPFPDRSIVADDAARRVRVCSHWRGRIIFREWLFA